MKAQASLIFILLCLPLAAQVSSPKVGTVRYSDGSLHSVQGLADNLIVCDLPIESADAASFSDQGGLIAKQGTLQLLDAHMTPVFEYQTGEPSPLLDIEGDATTALAWLPSKRTLLRWNGSNFDQFVIPSSDLDGKVTNLQASNAKQARLLVIAGDGSASKLTFSTRNGSLISSEPLIGVHAYVYSQSFFFVYEDNKQLYADNMNGYRRSVAVPASDIVIDRMSSQWLHLYSPSLKQDWALHLTQAELQLSLLPVAAAPKVRSASALAHPASGEPK